jgi:hypothetical protein
MKEEFFRVTDLRRTFAGAPMAAALWRPPGLQFH